VAPHQIATLRFGKVALQITWHENFPVCDRRIAARSLAVPVGWHGLFQVPVPPLS